MATAREEDTGGRTITPPQEAAHPAPAASGAVTPGAAVLRAEGERGGIPRVTTMMTMTEIMAVAGPQAAAEPAGIPPTMTTMIATPGAAAVQAVVAVWADTGEPGTLTR